MGDEPKGTRKRAQGGAAGAKNPLQRPKHLYLPLGTVSMALGTLSPKATETPLSKPCPKIRQLEVLLGKTFWKAKTFQSHEQPLPKLSVSCFWLSSISKLHRSELRGGEGKRGQSKGVENIRIIAIAKALGFPPLL